MNKRNFVANYLVAVTNLVTPIAILPILSNNMSLNDFGKLSIFQVLFSYILNFVDYGLTTSAPREVANKNKETLVGFFWNGFCVRSGAALISIVVYIVLGSVGMFPISAAFTVIVCVAALAFVFQPFWILNSLEKVHEVAHVYIFLRVITSIVLVVYCLNPQRLEVVLTLLVLTYFIPNTSTFLVSIMRNSFLPPFSFSGVDGIRGVLKRGGYIAISSISTTLVNGSIVLVASLTLGFGDAGGVSVTEKVCRVGLAVAAPFTISMLPHVSQGFSSSYKEGVRRIYRGATVLMPAYLLFTALVFAFSADILKVFGSKFVTYEVVLKLMVVWSALSLFNNFIGVQYFIGRGESLKYSIIFHCSVLLLIVLYGTLPSRLGVIGLPMSVLISEGLFTIICVAHFVKENVRQ